MKPSFPKVREVRANYTVDDTAIINQALAILHKRLRRPGEKLTRPEDVKNYLRLTMHGLEHEEFWVLFMDVKNRLIATEKLSIGTLNQASVYPREVLKMALKYNAGSVLFAHNHPSGNADPSEADKRLTHSLTQALALVDIRTLDHIIVGEDRAFSFAENGLI